MRVYDINDQVNVVRQWWKELQEEDVVEEQEKLREIAEKAGKDSHFNTVVTIRVTLPMHKIARRFVNWKIFQDVTAAKKYLFKTVGDGEQEFDFNAFLAVFIKGIFKDVVTGIASTV